MRKKANLTTHALKVLRPFLDNPHVEIAGIDVMRSSHLASGTAYPIMLRLERQGLLTSRWEAGDPVELGRPRRRYYQITPLGAAQAKQELEEIGVSNVRPIPELNYK